MNKITHLDSKRHNMRILIIVNRHKDKIREAIRGNHVLECRNEIENLNIL